MAEEVVVNCETGEVVVQADTFLATKPVFVARVPVNANQALVSKLQGLTLASGGEADLVRQAVITVLQGQPSVPAI